MVLLHFFFMGTCMCLIVLICALLEELEVDVLNVISPPYLWGSPTLFWDRVLYRVFYLSIAWVNKATSTWCCNAHGFTASTSLSIKNLYKTSCPGCPGTQLCRQSWLWPHRDPPASISQMLGLKACATAYGNSLLINWELVSLAWLQTAEGFHRPMWSSVQSY